MFASSNECYITIGFILLLRLYFNRINTQKGYHGQIYNYSIAALLILYCFIPGSAHATQQLPLYELAVKIDPARHTMQGLARITLQKGTACKINAQNFDLQRVLINNKDEKPLQGMIDIRAAQQDTLVEITYSASFAPGPAEGKGDLLNAAAPNCISPEGIMLLNSWYPTIDGLGHYKLSAEIPEHFEAVSEAETTTVKSSSGRKNIIFDFPHPLPE